MSLAELRAAYRSGTLDKQAFIAAAYEVHALLFDYADLLADTEIGAIEISDGAVTMTVRDTTMRVTCARQDRRTAPIEALNFGAYEPAELAMVLSLVEPGATVYDIGANVGWYSLRIATTFPDVTVLAFEPVPATFATLAANIAANACANVTAHNLGFSDHNGTASFFVDASLAVNASLADHSTGAGPGSGSGSEEVTCTIRRLDDFVADTVGGVDLIKCDVEGAELLVFRGGLSTIRHHRPAIVAEMLRKWSAPFGYHPNEIIELLADVGYRCFSFRDGGLAEFLTMDDSTVDTNFVFLHAERHAGHIERSLL
ncbi:MAG: FkbM family methyltransferase [Acidimicrobiales bacterium]